MSRPGGGLPGNQAEVARARTHRDIRRSTRRRVRAGDALIPAEARAREAAATTVSVGAVGSLARARRTTARAVETRPGAPGGSCQ